MKKSLNFLLALVFLAACSNNANNKESEKVNYENTKAKLAARERENPLNFLSISADVKKNIIRQTVVKSIIANNASIAAYKNIRIKLLYYKQGKLVTNHEEVYDEIIKPNSKHEYKSRYYTPKGTDSVAVSIMNAEVVK